MMKKLLLLAAAAMLLFACSKEDSAPDGKTQRGNAEGQKFYASFEATPDAGTKIYADEQLRLLWNEGDRISIFNQRTYNDQYEFDGEDGDNAGGFDYIPPSSSFITSNPLDNIYAVYPYNNNTKINNDGDIITVILPDEQTYKEKSFGVGANTMVAMTDGNFLGFKNVCGYLKFRFWGDNIRISSITLKGNNNERIAGKASVYPVLDAAPTVVMTGTATRYITINCPEPVQIGSSSAQATEFIFVIPPTVFSEGFKVTVTDAEGGTFEKSSTRSLEIKRNKMESMGAMKVTPNYDGLYVEFDDENFEAYCVENFANDPSLSKLSIAEAKAVTEIDLTEVTGGTITSLGGLEHFTNLTSLDLSGHGIAEINLGTLGKLEEFTCQYNYVVEQIDFSHNTALKSIDMFACISMQSLDVSHNTDLEYLRCAGGINSQTGEVMGHLASVNVSNNPILKTLQVQQNLLTSLDVSNCNDLETLNVSRNHLTTLDVSANSELETLNCSYNNLTSIVTDYNPNLAVIQASYNSFVNLEITGKPALHTVYLENCTSLKTLSLEDNALALLRVFGCENLEEIQASNNMLEQAADINLCDNIKLNYLSLIGNKLASIDLGNCRLLLAVNLGDNKLTSLDISNNPFITSVTAWNNQISTFTASNANTELNNLNLSDNQLTTIDVSMLPSLRSFYVPGNQLTSVDVSHNGNLDYFTCYDNNLTSLDVSHNPLLNGLLCYNNNLTELDLSANPKMFQLDCSNNQLTSLDLSTHTDLWYVGISGNKITSLDVSKSASLYYLIAWPQQTGYTFATLRKKTSANITYMYAQDPSYPVIDPADYGTTVINVD